MKIKFTLIIRSLILIAAFSVQLPTSSAKDVIITEFESDQNRKLDWRIVNDGVMGGLSRGKVSFLDGGTMRFEGNLSLENNGGFSSVRTAEIALDLSDSEGFSMRVKGDGRTYQLRLSTDARYRSGEVSFKADFPTTNGKWQEVTVPFAKLTGSWRGRLLKDEVFDPGKIQRISFLLGDKKPGPFKLEVDWVRTYDSQATIVTGARNLVETAAADGRFKTLAMALNKAELLEVLQGEGPFTVLAPTDDAFAGLPEERLSELLKPSGQEKLKSILKYHVIAGAANLSDALKAGKVATVQGESINIAFEKGRVLVNEASLIDSDIECSNGVIHVIDAVLLPPDKEPKSILATAAATGGFSNLLAAIDFAGLTPVLEGEGPFTVFAPTDAAIDALPGATEELLLEENSDQLKEILTYHVVGGRVSAGDALNLRSTKTLNGNSITFTVYEGMLKANKSTILTADLNCANGVIHVIDTVLLPPTDSAEQDQKKHANMNALERIMAAIDKGVPLYNDGDPAACAKVYESCVEQLVKDERVGTTIRSALATTLEKAKTTKSADARAWLLRQNLDRAFAYLRANHH